MPEPEPELEPEDTDEDPTVLEPVLPKRAIPRPASKTQETRKCPFCAETILAEAIKCRFCDERLDGPTAPQPALKRPGRKPGSPTSKVKKGPADPKRPRLLLAAGIGLAGGSLLVGLGFGAIRIRGEAPDAPAAAAVEEHPPPAALVSETTVSELVTLTGKWKSEFPVKDDLEQRADETTQDYRKRVSQTLKGAAQWSQAWRSFNVGGDLPSSSTPGAKFVREQKLTLAWECVVFDVRAWRSGASEVLCATGTDDTWAYSAVGAIPSKTPLRKGDRIAFTALNTSLPNDEEYFRPRMVGVGGDTLGFKVLSKAGGAAVAEVKATPEVEKPVKAPPTAEQVVAAKKPVAPPVQTADAGAKPAATRDASAAPETPIDEKSPYEEPAAAAPAADSGSPE